MKMGAGGVTKYSETSFKGKAKVVDTYRAWFKNKIACIFFFFAESE